jgi:hypothetical protein
MNGPKVEVAALEKSDQMLEHLEHPQVLADLFEMGSDNLRGVPQSEEPGNQQERLVDIGWVIGFVDGEGCFSIGLVQQPDRGKRKGYRTGYQLSHDFRVTQGAKSIETLHALRKFFGVGAIYPNRRKDNHREDMYAYSVHRRDDIRTSIVPFFRSHPLRTAKQLDFQKFVQCLEIIERGEHLTREGLARVLEIAQTMNRQVPRDDVIRILRGHTSDIPRLE